MVTKLTLSINKGVIRRAKNYALKSNRSLSEIVETYLNKITQKGLLNMDDDLDQIVGIISLGESFDEKREIRKILNEKHAL